MITRIKPAPLWFHMAGWLAPFSLMENTWRPHSLYISGFSWCNAQQRESLVQSLSLEGQSSSEICPLQFPLASDCYLAFQWRLALPLGMHGCACQQECIGSNRGRWRMVSSCCCCCFSLCVKMSPLIQPPPLPLPQPSLCLLSLFVSEMIPSVMSKATLSYSCCLGNQHWERQRLKASMMFEAGKHERFSVVLWEFED